MNANVTQKEIENKSTDSFSIWLKIIGFSDAQIKSCLTNLSFVSFYCVKRYQSVDLFKIENGDTLIELKNNLVKDDIFRAINKKNNNELLTALDRYHSYTIGNKNKHTNLSEKQELITEIQAKRNNDIDIKQGNINRNRQHIDFLHPEYYINKQPVACTIRGHIIVPSQWKWPQLLVAISEWFISSGNIHFNNLDRIALYGINIFLMPKKTEFYKCTQLSNGKWINTNYSHQAIITIIRNLCTHCGIDLNDVDIIYESKTQVSVNAIQTRSNPAYTAPAFAPKQILAPLVVKKLTDILLAHFSNGYRLNSPIEMMRFRSYFSEDYGEEITLNDEEMTAHITACGTVYEGKVYVVSTETKEKIKEMAEEYFKCGAQAIFFAAFYEKHENWLFEVNITSEDMLISVLRKLFPKLSFTQTYFGYTDASISTVLESEILRVWYDDILLTYDQLAERLLYIPIERIKHALSQNGDFIWNSVETFSHINRIEITHEEREAIQIAVVRACNDRGFTAITDLSFGEIEHRNSKLSVTAIHNAIYRICLSDNFDKKGKIITRKGDFFDVFTIMKEYCRIVDKCSLNDLLNYEMELSI